MLPTELVACIVSMLDPTNSTDRTALARVARSSQALYDLAMPVLYRELVLDDDGILDLLACGHLLSRLDTAYKAFTAPATTRLGKDQALALRTNLPAPSERWRRSLRLVRTMTVYSPISAKALYLLWDVCIRGEPLFPGVTKLRSWDRPSIDEEENSFLRFNLGDAYSDEDIMLFECPDLCVKGRDGAFALCKLPSRDDAYRHVTSHGIEFRRFYQPPSRWTTLRQFEHNPTERLDRRRRVHRCGRDSEYKSLEELVIVGPDCWNPIDEKAIDGPVELFLAFRNIEKDEEARQRVKSEQEASEADWRKVAELVDLHHGGNPKITFGDFDDPNPPDCPPCMICGKSDTCSRD